MRILENKIVRKHMAVFGATLAAAGAVGGIGWGLGVADRHYDMEKAAEAEQCGDQLKALGAGVINAITPEECIKPLQGEYVSDQTRAYLARTAVHLPDTELLYEKADTIRSQAETAPATYGSSGWLIGSGLVLVCFGVYQFTKKREEDPVKYPPV